MYCYTPCFFTFVAKKNVHCLTALAATEDISSVSLQNQFPFLGVGCSKFRKNSARFLGQISWRCGAATKGAARTFGEALRRSTVAHFARKVRGTNIVAAKHG